MFLILQSIVLIDYCHYIQEVAKTRHFEYIIYITGQWPP